MTRIMSKSQIIDKPMTFQRKDIGAKTMTQTQKGEYDKAKQPALFHSEMTTN